MLFVKKKNVRRFIEMTCGKCQTLLVEIARYDGDRIVSVRLRCPVCESSFPEKKQYKKDVFLKPARIQLIKPLSKAEV